MSTLRAGVDEFSVEAYRTCNVPSSFPMYLEKITKTKEGTR